MTDSPSSDDKSSRLPPALRENMWSKDNLDAIPHKKKGTKTGMQLRTLLRKLLDSEFDLKDPITRETYKMTAAQAIALQLVKRGLEGNLAAISMIWDRVEGKVTDKLAVMAEVSTGPQFDLSQLSSEELEMLRMTMSKAKALPSPEDIEELEIISER
jgi:hypothetical protein